MIIITLSLSLTVYQDDISSVFYLLLMQFTLNYSMKERGRYTGLQLKYTKIIMGLLAVLAIFKGILYLTYNKSLTKEEFEGDYYTLMKTFGFEIYPKFYDPNKDGTKLIQFQIWKTFDFEFLAMLFNLLLYVFYNSQ